MPSLSESRIADLLAPYASPSLEIVGKLSDYLDLLLRWNARTNLTAVREPQEIVCRHFGESLFAAEHLGDPLPTTLLDLGSGAGFPGLPIALAYPQITVTLTESQGKKASFLREAVRTLAVVNVEVWAARAEAMPAGRLFHTVTLRAVDNMAAAMKAAAHRAASQILVLSGESLELPEGFIAEQPLPIPGSEKAVLQRLVATPKK